MITAVDTSVLLDVFGADPVHGESSREALRRCLQEGRVVACAVVWAEVATFFPSAAAAGEAMDRIPIDFDPMTRASSLLAAERWREYRRRGGPRTRGAPDFLVGAHALHQAERLLTRDRGFYRSYFEGLTVLDPSRGP